LKKESIRHVDISYNSLNFKDMKPIEEGLKENHSLWGIHVIGNDAEIDSEGFVFAVEKSQRKMAAQDLFTHKLVDSDYQYLNPGRNPVNSKVKSYLKCWVCEGWAEKSFVWT
jgi:hypothetical protein